MREDWIRELEQRANALEGLSTTSSSKYDEFKDWLGEEFGVAPAVCFLSELTKQWTPRVGQALMGMPTLLVLLVCGESVGDAEERLSALHRYATGLHATLLLIGNEGAWRLGLVAGTPGRALYESLSGTQADTAASTTSPDGQQPDSSPDGAFDFMGLELIEQGELIWGALIGRGPLEFDEAIREAANVLRDDGRLGFERLRRDGQAYAALEEAIAGCARRGLLFDRPRRGMVRAVLRDAADFDREHWRDCIMSCVGNHTDWIDRDALVRAAAEWAVEMYGLEMQRLRSGGRADTAIRSAMNGLIRLGLLERQGLQLLRRAQRHGTAPPPSYSGETPPIAPSPSSKPPAPTAADSTHAGPELRAMVGDIPGEAEAVFMQLLSSPIKTIEELNASIETHLKEFEDAFEVHQFLDIVGAEKLAAECRRLLELWPLLPPAERQLAQAAILYFVESDEADDDFRIGGLRTDKAIMGAVNRVVLRDFARP